ncbi:MAG TPA: aldolase/citrate lyase family protein [Vicinamibacterales bacterium]|nr:aldolase/citrate lyase family protein [Vicinamibacterales bacterium]
MRRRRTLTAGAALVMAAAIPLLTARAAGQSATPAPRANPVIQLLEQGKPAFSIWANYIGVGKDYHAAVTLQNNKNFDFIIYDLEHDPFDVGGLSEFLRDLLDPGAIAREGVSVTKPVIVRIPPNGREIHQNQWMVKQILDTGVAGLMFPHIETAEQAINAIKAVRYPQPAGSPNIEPEGIRGASNIIAARYWGMSSREYELRSDVWGLRPGADMLILLIIENKLGVENVRDIARTLKAANIKCVLWAGGGDLSLSYGHDAALTEAGLRRIIDAGKEFGLPVGINGTADFQQRYDQGVRLFFDIGPAFAGGGPRVTPEQRKAVGR